MLTGSVLHIGATFVTIRNTNRIYYYHTVDFLRRFNAYGSVNVFFIYVTDTAETDTAPLQLHRTAEYEVVSVPSPSAIN